MSLPGKLTIGFLHEDNPLKSFFRMKPLLTEDMDGFMPSEIGDKFPEEGFIRIVPDKNEITVFKNRMRQMGRYCALDLRKHLGENDKIRPNKNYILGGPERNAFIVYSDVIGRLPMHAIAEVVDTEEDVASQTVRLHAELPGTAYVLLRKDGKLTGPWSWAAEEDEPGTISLAHADAQPFSEHSDEVLAGNSIRVPIDEDSAALLLYDLSVFDLVDVPLPEVERPAVERTPVESMPQSTSAMMGYDRLDSYHGMESTIAPRLQSKTEEAPWLVKSDVLRPRVVNTRLSLREQSLQAQSGFNPRRGRSLHEVVDEQWRKSRYDQLGHPVPTQATGRPIASPIERASVSVAEAWSLREARGKLVDELLRNEELREAIADRLEMPVSLRADGELGSQLNDMEEQRLKLIGEIDALRLKRDDTKAHLMDEVRRSHSQECAEYEQRAQALKAELARNEQAAKSAEQAAKSAEAMLQEAADKLDDRLMSSAVGQRMMDLARREGASHAPATHPDTYEPTAGELISDVRVQMERAGFALTNDEAVNLLACMMSGGTLILSGESGSGKSELARRLGDALGLRGDAARFVEARTPEDVSVRQLLEKADRITPLLLMLDDFNTGDCEDRMLQILQMQERATAEGLPLNLILTAQDAPEGQPVPSRLLSRSFLIRLKAAPASSSWRPSDLTAPAPKRAVSLASLSRIFAKDGELPAEITGRLQKLRDGLSKHGWTMDRRTLNELWYYCSSARPLMQCSGLELLDLALSQRAVPAMLASMELEALHELPNLLVDMPRCLSLMDQPLPLPPL